MKVDIIFIILMKIFPFNHVSNIFWIYSKIIMIPRYAVKLKAAFVTRIICDYLTFFNLLPSSEIKILLIILNNRKQVDTLGKGNSFIWNYLCLCLLKDKKRFLWQILTTKYLAPFTTAVLWNALTFYVINYPQTLISHIEYCFNAFILKMKLQISIYLLEVFCVFL